MGMGGENRLKSICLANSSNLRAVGRSVNGIKYTAVPRRHKRPAQPLESHQSVSMPFPESEPN